MYEEILEGLYRIVVPLRGNVLRELNAYLIKGEDRSLLIDGGFNTDECEEVVRTALDELGVSVFGLDFALTHDHGDHAGLLTRLAGPGSRVLRHPKAVLENARGQAHAVTQGFRDMELLGIRWIDDEVAAAEHPEFDVDLSAECEMVDLVGGEVIRYGPYAFEVIYTPGHSSSELCFYERSEKVMITGDHVLGDISPNITCWGFEENNLKAYLKSLDVLLGYEVKLALPGHRRPIEDLPGRIDQIKRHHESRLAEVRKIVSQGAFTVEEVTERMKWRVSAGRWQELDRVQKMFSLGEAMAHLNYLIEEGDISMRQGADGIYVFQPAKPGSTLCMACS